MCALNAVRIDPFLKAYYERKTKEGKHKMSTLNNVINKLLHRIYTVVKSGEECDKNYQSRATNKTVDTTKIQVVNIDLDAA